MVGPTRMDIPSELVASRCTGGAADQAGDS